MVPDFRILHGGISSGLNVVNHEKEPKLFIVKGKTSFKTSFVMSGIYSVYSICSLK
jgi:hypothetical protein